MFYNIYIHTYCVKFNFSLSQKNLNYLINMAIRGITLIDISSKTHYIQIVFKPIVYEIYKQNCVMFTCC